MFSSTSASSTNPFACAGSGRLKPPPTARVSSMGVSTRRFVEAILVSCRLPGRQTPRANSSYRAMQSHCHHKPLTDNLLIGTDCRARQSPGSEAKHSAQGCALFFPQGQHLVAIRGHRHGVLPLGRELAVTGDHGPAIAFLFHPIAQIGRASCRERVEISVVAVGVKKETSRE